MTERSRPDNAARHPSAAQDLLSRLARLEEILAHQDKLSQDLSDMIARQSDEIERLARLVAVLMSREEQRRGDEDGGVFLGDERPPHW